MCSGDGTGYFTSEEPQTQNPYFFKVIEVESKWSEGRSLGVRQSWVKEENRALNLPRPQIRQCLQEVPQLQTLVRRNRGRHVTMSNLKMENIA